MASALLASLRRSGLELEAVGDKLRVLGPLNDDLRQTIRENKAALLAALEAERRKDEHADPSRDLMFRRWREVSIPAWRRILAESEAAWGQEDRAGYARWMLTEVLGAGDELNDDGGRR